MKKQCNGCGQAKPLEDFSVKSASRDGFQAKCKVCLSEYHRRYYQRNKETLLPQIREANRRRRKSVRQWINEIKSCGCQLCSETDTCCLDFHHLDSEEKELTIAAAIHVNSMARVLEEINKCVVLCRNCHSKVHAGRKSCEGLTPLNIKEIPEGMLARTESKTRGATIRASGRILDGLRLVLPADA